MKKIIFIIVLFLILTILIFFMKNDNKTQNIGNNKNIREIEQTMINIDSYKAKIDVTIKSNKNENTYKLEQNVTNETAKQIVLEPEILKGMEMIYENKTLTIQNTNLNISKVYNDYPYVSDNVLFLTTFLRKYSETESKTIEEQDGKIIMKIFKQNQYNYNQTLTIDRQTLKPQTLEIQNNNNQTRVYILYNEIEL